MPAVAVICNLVRDIVGGTPPRPGGAVFYQARVFAEIEHAIDVRLTGSRRTITGRRLKRTRPPAGVAFPPEGDI